MPLHRLYRAAAFFLLVLAGTYWVRFPADSLPGRWAFPLSDGFNVAFQVLAHSLIFLAAFRQRSWRPVRLDVLMTVCVTLGVQLSKNLLAASVAIRPSTGRFGGFPSGHASATFSLAFVLSLYYPRLWWVWYAGASLVSWSRVQSGEHTELQVAAGMVFGTLAAYAAAHLFWREKMRTGSNGT